MLSDHGVVVAAFDALDAALDGVAALGLDALDTTARLQVLERCERVRRRLPSVEHPVINQIGRSD